ncbi:MAG: group III truncated hemoglobin [Parvularculaceae bacterium]
MDTNVRSAGERRAQLQLDAASIGIDEAFISLMVDEFYTRVRENPLIGPIFDDAIGDNWTAHLAKMKLFWASVALNAGLYSGKPMDAHRRLEGVQPWQFNIWQALFRATLDDIAPTPAVKLYFVERAERIAQSLQLGMFGVPGIARKKDG